MFLLLYGSVEVLRLCCLNAAPLRPPRHREARAARLGHVEKVLRYLLDSDAVPGRCADPIQLISVYHLV